MKRDVKISIFSLKKSDEEIVQSDTDDLINNTIYPGSFIVLSFNALIQLIKKPIINAGILFSIIISLYRKPQSMLKSIATWWITLGVIAKLKRLNLDHIHAHWATYPSTSAYIIHRNTGISFSFTSHAHDIFLEDHMLYQKVQASAFSVTISNYNKKRLSKQLNLDLNDKMHIVHCGINTSDHIYTPEGRDCVTIMTVGRLDHIKGFSVLIDACKIYKQIEPEFVCNIIGNGPLKEDLQAQIINNDLQNNVKLLGVMPQEEIKQHLHKSTIFVLPSVVTSKGDMDGIPVALMEAMAAGLPVISTTVSGIPELIKNNYNGIVVEPGNPQQLAAAINELLSKPDKASEFSINARNTIENEFSIEIEAEKLYNLMIKSINNKGKSDG
jgi:glycosyltransferase involved in cell wall biosynthesis